MSKYRHLCSHRREQAFQSIETWRWLSELLDAEFNQFVISVCQISISNIIPSFCSNRAIRASSFVEAFYSCGYYNFKIRTLFMTIFQKLTRDISTRLNYIQ
jgi:hypothetical protein